MKFARRHTKPGISPYDGAELIVVPLKYGNTAATKQDRLSSFPVERPAGTVELPAHWSAAARSLCVAQCLVRDGIARALNRVGECDVPAWLWRSEPSSNGFADYRGEESLTEAIDRLCGAWTYHGWKGGYFDSEDDALTYYDETRWLLFYQKLSPAIVHWQYGGRHWAYGHDVASPSTYLTDYRTGLVRRAEITDLPALNTVINGACESFADEGGVWDLWRKEAQILSRGGNCGVNAGNLLGEPDPQDNSESIRLMDMGDEVARSSRPAQSTLASKRRLTIDATHPASGAVAKRSLNKLAGKQTRIAGAALAARHVQAIIDACAPPEPTSRPRRNAILGAALDLALQSARRALLPDDLIERTLYLAQNGLATSAADLLGTDNPETAEATIPAADGAVTVIRLTTTGASQDCRDDGLVDSTALAAWTGIECGLHFGATVDTWNTCPESGHIRSASGDGSYLFLDDTGSDTWIVDASAFQKTGRQFDVDGYKHAVEMLAVAADISLMTSAAVTPRLARRVWDYRPLALSATGLAGCLVRAGLAYDSAGGRAVCAGINALLSSTAYCTSARMAEELGKFPEFENNRTDMLRVLDRHSDMAATCAHEMSLPGLVEAIEDTWSEALLLGSRNGFRNAQVSVLCGDPRPAALLDASTAGPCPLEVLTVDEPSPAGYVSTRIDPAVVQGLQALGYSGAQIDAMVRHVVGHGTLAGAPGVNHETLRRRGFTEAAIGAVEQTLSSTNDIALAFDPFVLGNDYCRHMLGFGDAELQDGSFDMLAALGFSDAGIEAANIYCYGAGTLEGAPYLSPDHVSVFHCAEPQGARGTGFISASSVIRMMAAIQPHISGGIGHTLPLAADTSPEDCRAYLELGRRLGLKTITLRRLKYDLTTVSPAVADSVRTSPAVPSFAVIEGGRSANGQIAQTITAETERPEVTVSATTDIRTDVEDGANNTADVSQASRRASSHAARSTTSVSSSADVASSNGMFDVASP